MTAITQQPSRLERLRLRITSNPVMLKELRGRMRGRRAFVVLTLYLALLSGLAGMIYAGFAASESIGPGGGTQLSAIGKTLFSAIVAVELFLVCFVTPAFTAAGISGERERQTFDLLRTTLLPARALVLGKLLSALSYVLLLIFAALPLQSLAFLLGGIGPEEIAVSFVLLVVTALAFSALGIFFSSVTRTTLASTVLTYAALLTIIIGLPMLVLLALSIMSAIMSPMLNSLPVSVQAGIIYFLWLLVSINPAATAVATEIIVSSEHTVLIFSTSGPSGTTLWLISPWIPYTLIYLLLSVLLFVVAVRRVQKVDR